MRESMVQGVKNSGAAAAPGAELLLEAGGLSRLPVAVLWHLWLATGRALPAMGLATLRAWMHRSRQRRRLAELTDRELDDIGISRDAAMREAGKPFWID